MSQLKAVQSSSPKMNPAQQAKKLFIAGVGAVGHTLLKQVSRLGSRHSLRVLGVCNRNHVLWYNHSETDYSLDRLKKSPGKNWESVLRKLGSYKSGSVVFVDTTGSEEVADIYLDLLKLGIHVVTPSKLANTRSQSHFDDLQKTAKKNGVKFLYETNVGAGLPVIQTIRDFIETGDKIIEISGVLSGTMTYLFSELDKGRPFSQTVIQARTLGYAEPDPRDDLSGEDVARKFLILARICGLTFERGDIEVESLIPEPLREVDAATFLERLPEFDIEWREKLAREQASGNTLRFTGTLKDGKIRVSAKSVPQSSPLGRLSGTNNLIQIKTRRYYDQPLIIQGPGAGKEVTATGVLADVLKTNS